MHPRSTATTRKLERIFNSRRRDGRIRACQNRRWAEKSPAAASGIGLQGDHVVGRPGDDAGIAGEVSGIERQQVRDAVNLHESDKPRGVDLNALDAVLDHELPPCLVNRGPIVENAYNQLYHSS